MPQAQPQPAQSADGRTSIAQHGHGAYYANRIGIGDGGREVEEWKREGAKLRGEGRFAQNRSHAGRSTGAVKV